MLCCFEAKLSHTGRHNISSKDVISKLSKALNFPQILEAFKNDLLCFVIGGFNNFQADTSKIENLNISQISLECEMEESVFRTKLINSLIIMNRKLTIYFFSPTFSNRPQFLCEK